MVVYCAEAYFDRAVFKDEEKALEWVRQSIIKNGERVIDEYEVEGFTVEDLLNRFNYKDHFLIISYYDNDDCIWEVYPQEVIE